MAIRRSLIKVSLSTVVALVLVSFLWLKSTDRIATEFVPKPTETAVKPVPDFSEYANVVDKKQAFFDYLKPALLEQNQHLINLRHHLQILQRKIQRQEPLTEHETQELRWLAKEYRVEDTLETADVTQLDTMLSQLLMKIDIIPIDLALVQAANESAWGTSRFARQGYNFFGLWCFKKGCGFVPKRRNEDASHEVARFPNLTRAVYTYVRNLNRHQAYAELREIRSQLRQNNQPITGKALSEGLLSYSERGPAYVEELQAMIRFNEEYIGE